MVVKKDYYGENFEKDLEKIKNNIFEKKEKNLELKIKEKLEQNQNEEFKNLVKKEIKNIFLDKQLQEKEIKDFKNLLPIYIQKDNSLKEYVKIIIEQLINLALKEGIEKAIKASLKYSYFIQDAFHDALVDRFLPYLKEKEKNN